MYMLQQYYWSKREIYRNVLEDLTVKKENIAFILLTLFHTGEKNNYLCAAKAYFYCPTMN